MGVMTIAIFNICGVSVTKYVSSLARSIVDVTRTVMVWIVGLIVTTTYYDGDPSKSLFHWENTKAGAIVVEAIGFILLVTGNMTYNEIIIFPFAKPPGNNS